MAASTYELGRDTYNYRCYFCHGYSGDGKTLASSYLSPKPRDFTAAPPDDLTREAMISAVRLGRENSAMVSFAEILNEQEIEAVIDFIRTEFMSGEVVNTRYHTAANGWPNHERFANAFPFVTGELALDAPWDALTEDQQAGRRLFMASCVTCHDRATVQDEGEMWRRRSISYPRGDFIPGEQDSIDTISTASPYGIHDIPPVVDGLTQQQKRGESLFLDNCAFCHGADGTGKNWIGSFLASPPRNLTDQTFWQRVDQARLERIIAEGVENTTMPAWKFVMTEDEIASIASYVLKAFRKIDGVP
jgi:cytochrome c oxidase cbb3-type subunit 3